MTRVLLVDDHPVYRRGLAALVAASGFDVAGEAASGEEAISAARTLGPDVVLMDLRLPELHGIEATERIVAENPAIRVVVVTMLDDDEAVRAALAAGAIGYVVKDASPEEIIAALRAAVLGASLVGSGVRRPIDPLAASGSVAAAARSASLTRRESQTAALLAKGLSNRAIAGRFGVSEKTVANYVSSVLLKLGVRDRYEAGRLVRERANG